MKSGDSSFLGDRGACLVACGILVPWPGTELTPPAVEVRSLNHWTSREVSMESLLKRAWSYSCGFHLHDLIPSQMPHLQMPSHWGLGFNMWLLGGHQYSVSSALGREWHRGRLCSYSCGLGRGTLSSIPFQGDNWDRLEVSRLGTTCPSVLTPTVDWRKHKGLVEKWTSS